MRPTCRILHAHLREAVLPTAAGYELDAEKTWHLEGDAAVLDEVVELLPSNSWTRIGGVVVLEFGNTVGDLELPHLGRLRLRSGKWNEVHFESMLADITERSAALPFSASGGGALPYDRSLVQVDRILLHAFVYLRHALSSAAPREHQVLPALRAVVADPHRRFDRSRRWVDTAMSSRVDSRTLHGLLTGAGQLERWVGGAVPPMAARLGGRLPRRVNEPHSPTTVDVPENRFVKAFLTQIDAVLSGIESLGDVNPNLHSRLCTQVRDLRAALQPITSHSLWRDVGVMHRFPAESTVLQRRFGYREVLRHFVRLRQSSHLAHERTWEQLLEVKDVATLYELWCFYEVLRGLEGLMGPPDEAEAPRRDELQETLPHDLRVTWASGVELYYNYHFSRSRALRRQSYSLPMRPDIALWVPGDGYHLLDAKFRMRLVDAKEGDLEEGPESEASGLSGRRTYKRSDLNKMHAYRDAIPLARSAWVLYPGSRRDSWEAPATVGSESTAWEGVGVLPSVPGARSVPELSGLLKRLLGLGGNRIDTS